MVEDYNRWYMRYSTVRKGFAPGKRLSMALASYSRWTVFCIIRIVYDSNTRSIKN